MKTMNMPIAERRQIENEMIFRRDNEKIGDDIEEVDLVLIGEGNQKFTWDDNSKLHFKCECSDENCDERILLKLSKYKEIHENRKTFIVMPNHQVDSIETIIRKLKLYTVVKKNNSTAEPGTELNKTIIDNSEKS